MIKTNGDFVSEVRNHVKGLTKDDHISARYILSVAHTYIQYLINNRPLSKVFRDLSSFTYVPCVPMERIKSVKCEVAEFRTCEKIMRSKERIPEIFNSKAGYIIESVTNIDSSVDYDPIRSIADFKKNSKREFGNEFKYFYISDGYVYIVNSTSEIININALFLDEEAALKLSDCEECDDCKSKLDNKFICPSEFLSTVRDQTLNIILTSKQIPEDENPNLDSNQKTVGR